MFNCTNCKYAKLERKFCYCNIHALDDNHDRRIVVIKKNNIKKECPCHSNLVKEEFRYGFTTLNKRLSNDTCFNCQRTVSNKEDMVVIKEKLGSKTFRKNICIYCNKLISKVV